MHERPTVILIGAPQDRVGPVKVALQEIAELRLEPNVAFGVGAARKHGAQIAIIDLEPDADPALRTMQDLKLAEPEVQVVALAAQKDPDLILHAMRAGAREFVVLDRTGELGRVIAELARQLQPEQVSGTIVSMFPAKGGMGATSLATNLASMLQAGDQRVVLVDLDLQLGDVLVFLDMASRYTIADVLHHMKRLDRELLFSSVARHSSGVDVLAQSDHIEDADKITPPRLAPLLKFLARHYDFVVVDGLRGFDDMALAALDASDRILLVLTQDVPSIKNAQRCLDVFRRLEYSTEKVRVVLNRYTKSEKIDLNAIADNLGVEVASVVANDYPSVIKAINRGILLSDAAPRARVTEDVRRLAGLVAGGAEEAKPQQNSGGGFLRGLFGGGTKKNSNHALQRLSGPTRGGEAPKPERSEADESESTPEAG